MKSTARRVLHGAGLLLTAAIAGCDGGAAGGEVLDAKIVHHGAEIMSLDPSSHIGLEALQVYGGSATGEGPLYRPLHLDVDAEGNVFVADNGNKNVVRFSKDGEMLGTMGGPGQGPGEIQATRGIAVSKGQVFVLADRARINTWDTAGVHIRDMRLPHNGPFLDLSAFDDGTLVASHSVQPRSPGAATGNYIDQIIAGYTVVDTNLQLSREIAVTPRIFPTRAVPPVAHPSSLFAVARSGRVYLSDAATYEITAIAATGDPLWRLVADVEPPRVTESDIETGIAPLRRRGITRSSYEWPEHLPALRSMVVDGHGHLYVYRFVRNDPDATRLPVDVYRDDGAHLFSGTIDRNRWLVGRGDLVYGIEEHAASGGRVVVAHRLLEPFDQ